MYNINYCVYIWKSSSKIKPQPLFVLCKTQSNWNAPIRDFIAHWWLCDTIEYTALNSRLQENFEFVFSKTYDISTLPRIDVTREKSKLASRRKFWVIHNNYIVKEKMRNRQWSYNFIICSTVGILKNGLFSFSKLDIFLSLCIADLALDSARILNVHKTSFATNYLAFNFFPVPLSTLFSRLGVCFSLGLIIIYNLFLFARVVLFSSLDLQYLLNHLYKETC